MPTEVIMPQMGESIFEGTITKWLKKPGDSVEKDEPLFEISTDKVDAEIPSPVAGILTEIRFPEGATVEVNTVVAVIGEPGMPKQVPSPVQEPAAPAVPVAGHRRGSRADTVRSHHRRPAAFALRRWPAASPENTASTSHGSPAPGSEGRITKDDVLRAVSAANRPSKPATPQVAQVPPRAVHSPSEPVPLTRMRAIIAERMVESVRISPARPHRLQGRHDAHRASARAQQGRLRAAPRRQAHLHAVYRRRRGRGAAPRSPSSMLRSKTLGGLAIRYHQNINLGIAVALDWGLIVPVVRQAEQRSFPDLGRAIADLALRARTKKLSPDEVGGSTFTLTNAGAFGGEFGMPIINQPESAILAVGGLRKEPAVLTDAEGNDTIAIRSMQYFCLGFDHRLIDGADGGKFMVEFKRQLESWNQEIL